MADDNQAFVPEAELEDSNEVRPSESAETQPTEDGIGSKERLMIHKIVNENFKSYAGKQELGPFHKVYL